MEYHVRSARLTDVDAAIRILVRDPGNSEQRRGDTDRLRNLLFVPSATVVVAEAERRIVGIGVLSIRPSVRSGPFIGVIDELGVAAADGRSGSAAPATDAAQRSGMGVSIIEHLVVSARNIGLYARGCHRSPRHRRAGASEARRVRETRGAAEPRRRLKVSAGARRAGTPHRQPHRNHT